MSELDLFAAAIAIADPVARAALLDRECAGRPELRRRLDLLLDAHAGSHSLLDRPDEGGDPTGAFTPRPSLVGTVIAGRYKLLEEIGEGGMGTVWVAEQTEPVRRKVALKVIKAGMDSGSVLARFEAERQALALMDHPNIARVLDGGLTDQGRPFFVMEYVKGVPITQYCDAVRLSVTDRLNLFVQVCHAVQHAHQKGIIHRDLKPSNILVAPYDDKPVPKIIDFGLAKAMHQSLTDRTLHTAHDSVLGTPLYMSPEQAQLNNLDVDTRTDIYSLGVLLYELLTGTTPVERKRFKEAAWDEMRRIIRDEEPPPPSTRLSSTDTLPVLAAGRQTEPTRLTKLVRGELDWIVMKALEKDRTRRYETANGFGMDVGRFLAGEPVLAVPPSTGYRMRKFAKKHRSALTMAASVLVLLLGGIAGSGYGMIRATRAAEAERLAKAEAVEQKLDADAQRKLAEDREQKAREEERKARLAEAAARESEATSTAILNFVKDDIFGAVQPNDGTAKEKALGLDATLRQFLEAAEPKLAKAFANQPKVEARLRLMLGGMYSRRDVVRALTQYVRAYDLALEHLEADHEFIAAAEFLIANAKGSLGKQDEAAEFLEKAVDRRRKSLGKDHAQTILALNLLESYYRLAAREDDRKRVAQELLENHLKKELAPGDLKEAGIRADLYYSAGKTDEAIRTLEAALPAATAKHGAQSEEVLRMIGFLARCLKAQNRVQEAIAKLEPACEIMAKKLGPTNQRTLNMQRSLTDWYRDAGRYRERARLLDVVLTGQRMLYGPTSNQVVMTTINLIDSYTLLGEYQNSIRAAEGLLALIPAVERKNHGNLLLLYLNLAEAYDAAGDPAAAERTFQQVENEFVRPRGQPGSIELDGSLSWMAVFFLACNAYGDAERVSRELYEMRKAKPALDAKYVTQAKGWWGAALAGQKKHDKARPLLEEAAEGILKNEKGGSESTRATVLRSLAVLYADTDRAEKAIEICRREIARGVVDSDAVLSGNEIYVSQARWCALAAGIRKAMRDPKAAEEAKGYADRAIQLLQRAQAAGYGNFAPLRRCPDLDSIRDRDDFKKLLPELEPKTPPKAELGPMPREKP